LARVELGDDTLQDLVNDGRQNTLVIVGAQLPVDGGERLYRRPGEDTASDVHHLQVCDTGQEESARHRAQTVKYLWYP